MLRLRFATSGTMTITLTGFTITKHIKDPTVNVKTYVTGNTQITLIAKDMKTFSEMGIIEISPVATIKDKSIDVCIDSEVWAWYGSAQTILDKDGQMVLNDTFQSGTKGPIGNAKRFRAYPVEV